MRVSRSSSVSGIRRWGVVAGLLLVGAVAWVVAGNGSSWTDENDDGFKIRAEIERSDATGDLRLRVFVRAPPRCDAVACSVATAGQSASSSPVTLNGRGSWMSGLVRFGRRPEPVLEWEGGPWSTGERFTVEVRFLATDGSELAREELVGTASGWLVGD